MRKSEKEINEYSAEATEVAEKTVVLLYNKTRHPYYIPYGDLQRTPQSIYIPPGAIEVPAQPWMEAKESNALVAGIFRQRLLTELQPVPYPSTKMPFPEDAEKMIEVISETRDDIILLHWKNIEVREVVLKALVERLQAIEEGTGSVQYPQYQSAASFV